MIKSFADKRTQDFYVTGKSRKLPASIFKAAKRKLDYLQNAYELDDLRSLPATVSRVCKVI